MKQEKTKRITDNRLNHLYREWARGHGDYTSYIEWEVMQISIGALVRIKGRKGLFYPPDKTK